MPFSTVRKGLRAEKSAIVRGAGDGGGSNFAMRRLKTIGERKKKVDRRKKKKKKKKKKKTHKLFAKPLVV